MFLIFEAFMRKFISLCDIKRMSAATASFFPAEATSTVQRKDLEEGLSATSTSLHVHVAEISNQRRSELLPLQT